MLETVANLANSNPSSSKTDILSVDVMQQSVIAVKTLASDIDDYDPVTFLDKIDMTKFVDNMEKSVSDLTEEVRSDKTLNSYTSVSLTDLYKYSSRCRTSYSRRIISCSHG